MNLRPFLPALAATLTLAACSGTTTTSAPTTTAPPTTAAPALPTTVTSTTLTSTTLTSTLVEVAPAVPAIGATVDGSILTADGRTRTYHVYVPRQLPSGPVPLLFAFHGGTGWGKQFQRNSGLDGLAEANGFLVVFPDGVGAGADEGTNRTWNGGDCCGAAARNNVDDVGFVRQLLDTLEQQYAIDPVRVFSTGHSNGGILSYRLACELSDRIAAVGFQSGTMEIPTCAPSGSVSLLHIHGNADTNLPIDGGVGADSIAGVDFVSPRLAVVAYSAAQHCAATPTMAVDAGNPDITVSTWTGCDGGTQVQFVEVDGAPHSWMGHQSPNPAATPAYQALDASVVVVEFLLNHPRVG